VQTTKQQQILGYFIEEAKEHLNTIENGLLNLNQTMADSEGLNELFRAAHSIKGGAAMLGFNSIQKLAHHLEDYFKLLKDNTDNICIDRQLEDLFLKGFDALQALVEQLQSNFELREEDAGPIVQSMEPVFAELGQYLEQLIQAGSSVLTPAAQQPLIVPNAIDMVTKILKVMLQLFKQGDTPKSRQQLIGLCNRLIQVSPKNKPWIQIGQTAQRAIANSANSYTNLAPVIITELKQASDLLLTDRSGEIAPSAALKQLTQTPQPRPVGHLSEAQLATQVRVNSIPLAQATAAAKTGTTPSAEVIESLRPRTITIPNEPKAAARALLDAFNKDELIQLAEFLMKSIQH
jgi:chemotaxis protein histidine kinase CheA